MSRCPFTDCCPELGAAMYQCVVDRAPLHVVNVQLKAHVVLIWINSSANFRAASCQESIWQFAMCVPMIDRVWPTLALFLVKDMVCGLHRLSIVIATET